MPFEEDFLARWSRRKAEDRLPAGSVDSTTLSSPAPEVNSAPENAAEPALDGASLEFSDFSRFVRDGISNAIQTAALRRLWLTSPLFGASDGLDVYRADYARASPLGAVPDIASRALEIAAVEQSAADQPASAPAAVSSPPNEVASGAQQEKQQEKLSPPAPQEPQSSD